MLAKQESNDSPRPQHPQRPANTNHNHKLQLTPTHTPQNPRHTGVALILVQFQAKRSVVEAEARQLGLVGKQHVVLRVGAREELVDAANGTRTGRRSR